MSQLIYDQTNTPKFDIAIIGAGLAGCLSAHILSQAGKKVCVIEKGRGSGGRASSKQLANDVHCDLGVPFIHAHTPESIDLFNTLVKEGIAAPWMQANTKSAQAFVAIPKMSALTRYWLTHSHFITHTRIQHLDQVQLSNNEKTTWLLRDDKYQAIALADNIIITTPAPQAAMVLASNPNLAVLLLRANQASNYQSQWAMWLETKSSDLGALIEPKNGPINRMIKDNDKPMRNNAEVDRWVIHADENWTKEHIDKDKDWVSHQLIQAFSEQTEKSVLQHGEPHRWLFSRFVEHKGNKNFAWSPENQIGLAGDWLCQGDAEGALLSAISLTNEIKDSL